MGTGWWEWDSVCWGGGQQEWASGNGMVGMGQWGWEQWGGGGGDGSVRWGTAGMGWCGWRQQGGDSRTVLVAAEQLGGDSGAGLEALVSRVPP